ncbi:MAG TPA: hypothetical protein VK817_24060 [Trebonia sp.]|jgi:hypothetical protein|nr:hypothetical protein [Trebonia sp.]
MALSKRARGLIITGAIIGGYAIGTAVAVRRGYSFGRNVIVRCTAGHLFTTVWVPGASVKSLRLGLWRLQWCPVGKHVTLVHPVKDADLTETEREIASERHDVPVP